PNIVTIHDFGHDQDTAFIVMELVPGRSLAAEIARGAPLGFERILGLMKELLSGLAAAHEHGVIHRDIKPSNLLLLPDGHLKIADFGVARLESSTVTRAGTILGTPSYMAPEQLAGKPVDRRADLFSVGVILYELLTGRRPFVGDSTYSVIYQVLHADPPLPSQLDLPLPKWIDGVVHRALAKDPQERFQDAREFAAALDAAAQTLHGLTEPTLELSALASPRSSPGSKFAPLAPKAAGPRWSWLAVGLLALALGALGWWANQEPEPAAREARGGPPVATVLAAAPTTVATQTEPSAMAPAQTPLAAAPAPDRPTPSAPAAMAPNASPKPLQARPAEAQRPRPSFPANPVKLDGAPPESKLASAAAAPLQERLLPPPPLADWRFNAPGAENLPLRALPIARLRRAAEDGDARAMNQLGNAYREGRGVERDLRQAASWFEKSAAAGNPNAMLALAAMAREGQGIPKDLDRALGLLKKAAESGNPRALVLLSGLYLKGEGVEQSDAKAAEYLRQAASQGERAAYTHLAYLHELGRGVSLDRQEALRLYRRAAEMGEPRARERLMQLGESAPEAAPPLRRFAEPRRAWRAEADGPLGAISENKAPAR
ncbi:MAG: protein kinase, partial [Burkholderiales bacterium]